MRADWAECCFEDLLNYEQPAKYIVSNTKYSNQYKTPVLTAGKSFIKGYTNEINDIFSDLPVIIFDDFTTASQFVNFKFKVKSSAMKILNPTCHLINMDFVFFCMQVNKIRNDTHKRYWISVYAKKKISLPSLPEQRAIVGKIETSFKDLDSGINHLKTAQTQLKTYRQAVLKKAFDGELTQEWRKNNKVDVKKWETIEFEKLLSYEQPTRYIVKSIKYSDSYVTPVLTAGKSFIKGYTNEIDGIFDKLPVIIFDDFTTASKFVNFKFKVKSSAMKILNPVDKNTNVKFLFYYMSVNKIRNDTHKRYWISVYSKIKINLPSPVEQTQIVKEIENRLSACDKTEKLIADSLIKAEHLRQSILKKAFDGQLLTEAELAQCKKAKDYLPARELLKQIKAEKIPATKTKKTTKKTKTPIKKISTDIQAGLIAKVILLHEKNPQHLNNLTHIKCEKIAHLVESHLQIPLGRTPMKDAAGPDDYPHLKKVEHRARMANYFKEVKQKIGHTYQSGNNLNKAIDKFDNALSADKKSQVNKLLALFLKFDLESSEIVATLYAGWNNLLIDGKTPSDDEIVFESRQNWSERKLTLKKDRFYKALNWMRTSDIALIPTGCGVKVIKK